MQVLERAPDSPTLSEAQILESLESRIEKMAAYFGRQYGVDAEDLCQEAWVAVLEMLPRLDRTIGTPEQHLLKRARWRVLDTIRWQRRRQHLALSEIESLPVPSQEPGGGVDLSLLQARLTTTQQRILRALLEGYTWREAGALVGCSSANIAYHVRRIRAAYIALMEEE
ncbi:MAG TPA: sigma-70 family RNA polymerase sigma factor [Chthonomonadaceae bacterium]|nr:sigma-70 family RNA polymerase sigma factor [Chthonomonadaceae bacterium]